MAVELATAYVSILPSTSKLAPEIKKSLGAVDAAKPGGQIGDGLLAGIGGALKVGAVAVGAAALGGIGVALTKGFSRLDSLDQATAKLTGLGHSATTVEGIMANALASVRGTAFGMDEAASTAAGAVAAGVAPGQDLERTLKLVADAATIAGTDMGSMGSIFNKVAASGKLQGDVIAQLQDAGVPILQMVAKEMGVTAGEAAEMASDGAVSFDTFRNAMENGLGGAALESGATFSGAMDNMLASLGRVGANLLTGIFPQLKDGLGGLTDFLAPIEEKAKEVGAGFGDMLNQLVSGLTMSAGTRDEFAGQMDGLVLLGANLRATFEGIGAVVGTVFGWIGNNIGLVKNLAIGFGALAAAVLLYRGIVALLALPMQIATAAQIAWNIAMNLNPIGLIITAIIALVAAIIWVATQTTFFQDAWAAVSQFFIDTWTNISSFFTTVWNGILAVFQTVWAFIVAFATAYVNTVMTIITTVIGVISTVWNAIWGGISSFFGAIWAGIVFVATTYVNTVKTIITTVVNAISTVWSTVWNGISSFFTGIWANIIGTINTVKTAFSTVFTALGSIVKNAFNGVVTTVKSVINGIIDAVNGVIGGINSVAGAIGGALGIDVQIGKIPRLAKGGIISKQPGGIIANIGEGRHDEAVVPLDAKFYDALSGNSQTGNNSPSELVIVDADGQLIGRMRVEADQRIFESDSRNARAISRGRQV